MILILQEFYDYTSKAVMYNFKPLIIENNPFGTNQLREVHDFSTGNVCCSTIPL